MIIIIDETAHAERYGDRRGLSTECGLSIPEGLTRYPQSMIDDMAEDHNICDVCRDGITARLAHCMERGEAIYPGYVPWVREWFRSEK